MVGAQRAKEKVRWNGAGEKSSFSDPGRRSPGVAVMDERVEPVCSHRLHPSPVNGMCSLEHNLWVNRGWGLFRDGLPNTPLFGEVREATLGEGLAWCSFFGGRKQRSGIWNFYSKILLTFCGATAFWNQAHWNNAALQKTPINIFRPAMLWSYGWLLSWPQEHLLHQLCLQV